jgi:hypothetical protein
MSGAKDLLYKGSMIKETSQNLKHLGEMWNIDSLSQEGAKNEKNPGRAIGKAAAYTAGAYLGGLLGGAAGGAGGAGAEAAGNSAAALGDAEQAAVQAGMQTAPQATPMYSSFVSESPGPGVVAPGMQGFANADTAMIHGASYPGFDSPNLMEAGIQDTGYTPSSLKYALKNGAGANQPLSQTLGNYAQNKWDTAATRLQNPSGLLQSKEAKKLALNEGMGLMNPRQPMQAQQRPTYAPPQQQPPMLPYGLSEEEKRRLMMMYQGY